MINHTQAELSRILWENDPLGTCCNVNTGMEDEYTDIAKTMIELSKELSTDEAVRQAIIIHFYDDYFYNKKKAQLLECVY